MEPIKRTAPFGILQDLFLDGCKERFRRQVRRCHGAEIHECVSLSLSLGEDEGEGFDENPLGSRSVAQ